MNRKKMIRWVMGIPLLVFVLIVIILVCEPKQTGIARAVAYKAAALLLADRDVIEAQKKSGQSHFPAKEQDDWYVPYMEYLYRQGCLNPETSPARAEYAQGKLTRGEAMTLARALYPEAEESSVTGKKKGKAIPSGEWWTLYDELRKNLDPEGNIKEFPLLLYGTPMNVRSAPAWTAYTNRGTYRFEGLALDTYIDREIQVLARGGELVAIKDVISESVTYKNVWLSRGEGDTFSVHLGTIERTFPLADSLGQVGDIVDQVADLSLKAGKLQKVTLKKKRITGKVLAVKDDSIEIEGYGDVKLDEDFKVYKLYGQFEEQTAADILVGYDIQEFVVAHEKLCAALIMREFDAKIIRVLLMNTNFRSIFHPSVTLSADSGMILTCGQKTTEIPPGAEVIIYPTDERLVDGRIVFTPVEEDDEVKVNSVSRTLGTPSYGGCIEVRKEPEGLVAINELYLEDYLAKVVPSEMSEGFEMEALKAQAVCARTYAYRHIQSSKYSQYGAHVDDSTNFQVYNNAEAGPKTEEAVRETYGKLALYQERPIEAFYFSTSCGHTTDGSVWGSDASKYPYLDGCLLQEGRGVLNLSTNADFEAFIKNKEYPSYDSGYSMYRWETTVTNRQLEEEITAVGSILNVSVTERGVGGIAKQLRVEGSDGVTTINGEGQIRAKLGSPSCTIVRNDNSKLTGEGSLPSAYLAIENDGVNDQNITTFHIYGGGYGHGVGMSQNGAQSMAKAGKTYEEILQFFFHGVEVKEMEKEGA